MTIERIEIERSADNAVVGIDNYGWEKYGPGRSAEYVTEDGGRSLAWIDYTADGSEAWVTVFDYDDRSRNGLTSIIQSDRSYDKQPAADAEAIVKSHVEKFS